MKTKNFLLGFGEGILLSLLIYLLYVVKNWVSAQWFANSDTDILIAVYPVTMLLVVIIVATTISNNVHKLVFVQKMVPARDRVFECGGGLFSFSSLLFLFFSLT